MNAARIGGDCFAPDAAQVDGATPALLIIAEEDRLSCDRSLIAASRCMYDQADEARRGRAAILFAPETLSVDSRKRAHAVAARRGWRYVQGPVDPWSLLDQASEVFTLGHEIGFIGLLRGLPVRCFSRCFYAGWGITQDDPTILPRGAERSIEQIFAGTCLIATRYVDPFTGQECSFEKAAEIVADWRRIDRANRQIGACLGVSIWKQKRLRDLLRSASGAPRFPVRAQAAIAYARSKGRTVAVWATREPEALAIRAGETPVARIEDGFIRSVGLGADFMPGASIVVDLSGIYFDPTRPSDLDDILETTAFDPALIDRAGRLIRLLIARGVTKYNTGGAVADLAIPADRKSLFVPGQVENDRSVALGGAGIGRNIDLLARIRADNPEAFVVYKPHPDVDAGHRPGAVADPEAARFADRIVRGVSSAALIAAVDEVHTLTSLAGFEALIRGRPVTVYGQPFYAGWGLTRDMAPVSHRTRRLTMEQLVAGALILYPRYIDPATCLPCGPELLIERLADPDCWRAGPLVTLRRLQGAVARGRGDRSAQRRHATLVGASRTGGQGV